MDDPKGPPNMEQVNILLLGETGVGKSTFINAFVNYTTYDSLHSAKNNGLHCLIPSKFTITDENYEQKVITIGNDANECTETGKSATQATKAYKFIIQNENEAETFCVRFIDTPGIGDVRGKEQDERNIENVLDYISRYAELHAICVLLKPNNARMTVQFEFCLNKVLSQLDKSASRNILFVFTNTRGTFYRPGDTLPALERLLEGVARRPPYVCITLERKNVYCYDNEAFRFLAALENNVNFSTQDEANFSGSWERSSKECWSMLDYIRGNLVAHKVQDTISVNKARSFIYQISRPLADIMQLISDNIALLMQRKNELKRGGLSLSELKAKLYVPQTDVRLKELSKPVMVCASPQCVTLYTVNGKTYNLYKQRCHNPCTLTRVPKEIIGDKAVLLCAVFSSQTETCEECFCSYTFHMHIYYDTELFENNAVDINLNRTIETKEEALEYAKILINELDTKIHSYTNERSFVIKSIARLSHFLVNNSITLYGDTFKQHFEYLLHRESTFGEHCDQTAKRNFENLLKRYDKERRALQATENTPMTAEDVWTIAAELYQLPNFGQNILDAFEMQSKTQAVEFKNNEYEHRTVLCRQHKGKGKSDKPTNSNLGIQPPFCKQQTEVPAWNAQTSFVGQSDTSDIEVRPTYKPCRPPQMEVPPPNVWGRGRGRNVRSLQNPGNNYVPEPMECQDSNAAAPKGSIPGVGNLDGFAVSEARQPEEEEKVQESDSKGILNSVKKFFWR